MIADKRLLVTPQVGPAASFALVVGVVLAVGLPAYARQGDLDFTFGQHGRAFIDLPGDFDGAATVIQQPDGKLVVGRENEAANDDFSVLRFNVDGTLDASFGHEGRTS